MEDTAPTLWQRLWYTRLRDAARGRFDASLDWRRVIADAELPAELKQLAYETTAATRLWNVEKIDVARELIAHFHDGLDRGRGSAVLAATFGEPLQSARLIRRAKKRVRPLAWHVGRWTWWSVAGFAVFYCATALYLVMGRPVVTTDYLAIINERPLAVPEEQRAWPIYRQALAKMNYLNPSPKWLTDDVTPDDKGWPEAATWLREHAAALALIRAAANKPEMGMPAYASYDSYPLTDRRVFLPADHESLKDPETKAQDLQDRWLFSTMLPHVQLLREMARLLVADALRAGLAGDSAAAYADVVAILRMSHHCEEQPFFINAVVAAALQRLSFATTQELCGKYPALWSDDQLRDLAHCITAARVDWHGSFVGERYHFYDVVQRLYTDDGHGDGRITNEGLSALGVFANQPDIDRLTGMKKQRLHLGDFTAYAAAPTSLFLMASRAELTQEYNRLMSRMEAEFDRPLWDAPELISEIEFDNWSAFDKARFAPIVIFMPSPSSLRSFLHRLDGERDGVLVGLGLELYHREHGTWPKSLAELSPRWLPSVPIDRITGGPLRYKIVDDKPLVYSLGADSDDDGGQVPASCLQEDCVGGLCPYKVTPPDSKAENGDWVLYGAVKAK